MRSSGAWRGFVHVLTQHYFSAVPPNTFICYVSADINSECNKPQWLPHQVQSPWPQQEMLLPPREPWISLAALRGVQDGGGLQASIRAYQPIQTPLTAAPSAPLLPAGQVLILLHLTHQSDWLRKSITFDVFSVCCYEASYLFISNYATALTLYSLTIKSSTGLSIFNKAR